MEPVLARVQQRLDDLAVQCVGHHDTDGVDVVGPGYGLPARLRALIAISPRGIDGKGLMSISNGRQPHLRQFRIEHGRRRPVAAGVRAAGHPGPDHRHPDRRLAQRVSFAVVKAL
jgi:hypothetical protein